MKLEKITKQKNGKYKITFDNKEQLITYDEVILDHNLLQNKEIDEELLEEITVTNHYYEIYNKVLKFVSNKLRSEKETRQYLKKFDLMPSDNDNIIDKLKKIGFLNDENFAKSFASDKFNLGNKGPIFIKRELKNHNISDDIIEKALNELDTDEINEKIDKLINQKIKINHKYSNYLLKQKIVASLINSGFSKQMILNRLDRIDLNDNDILIKEFEKLYNKYSKKLTSPNLEAKLKQVLYQKGFKISEINKLIETKKN